RWFKPEFLANQVRLKPGGPIYSTLLRNDLDWLNKNPFRTVDLVYTPGENVAESDIVLQVQDRRPIRVYGGYEDSGNELTGNNRWMMGVNYGNLWGLDHQINYQWTANNRTDLLSAHSMSYIAPLPWRHTLTVFGAYVESSSDLPAPLDLDGHTGQLGMRYNIPLPAPPSWRKSSYRHELDLGYDYKNSTSNLEFFQIPVLGQNTDIHQFIFAYKGSMRDESGATSFGASFVFNPGDIGGANNTDAAYSWSRFGAQSSYTYGRLHAERLQRLPYDLSAMLRVTGQMSSENLLPSEQLGFGGYSSVRGYEENEANLDEGLMLTAELRSPSFRILPHLKVDDVRDEAQLLLFWDYATGSNVYLLPGESRHVTMSSIGPGLRWTVNDNFSMRLDYGFQLRESGQNLGLGDSRVHIGATFSY
ncbi:MAG TPA: ShlB/FhaC/HecB family hemolysin secretion/activation protein, partial [Bacteroidia bacterium]|nr:ShlB/FhaC/HecB family hemolysin secretion/activation protein [Bacteroidia bacterium]